MQPEWSDAQGDHIVKKVRYRGYVIHASPWQLAESEEWTIDLTISKDHGHAHAEKQFSANNTFKSEEEAVNRCIDFGKQIIDGESPTCTVTDL